MSGSWICEHVMSGSWICELTPLEKENGVWVDTRGSFAALCSCVGPFIDRSKTLHACVNQALFLSRQTISRIAGPMHNYRHPDKHSRLPQTAVLGQELQLKPNHRSIYCSLLFLSFRGYGLRPQRTSISWKEWSQTTFRARFGLHSLSIMCSNYIFITDMVTASPWFP